MGADRLVNAVAGFHKYGGPCVIVDLGTTINFDVVSKDAEFLGGLIAPGIGMSISGTVRPHGAPADGGFSRAREARRQQYGRQHQSGLYYGFIGMIDGIVERIAARAGSGDESGGDGRAGRC